MSRHDDATARVEAAVAANAADILAFFARRVTPADDAADLLSETLLVLWRRAAALPSADDEVRPWMFGIARNVLQHHRRAGARRSALADRLRAELAVTVAPGFADADGRTDGLRDALGRLDQVDQDIIGLVHWEGFTLAEAAGILSLRPATVRSRYHRARARLRADLSPPRATWPAPALARVDTVEG